MNLLTVESVIVDYQTQTGNIRAVNRVSFKLDKSETLGLVGESGSGKSTLGHSIIRLVPYPGKVKSGSIWVDGENILNYSEDGMSSIRGTKIGYIFQDPTTSLNPVKKIRDHFIELIQTHQPDVVEEEALARTKKILNDIGILPERINEYPHQFSGGMRQRIMIGLATALNPDLVIADEPTTALDVIMQAKILDLLKELRQTHKMALILITHDLGIIFENCKKIIVMYAGQFVEIADSVELYKNPMHPYTQGLLRTIPNIEIADQKLKSIPGSPPDMLNLPKGCPFWPRCPGAMKVCRKKEPDMMQINPKHSVRCFLHNGGQG